MRAGRLNLRAKAQRARVLRRGCADGHARQPRRASRRAHTKACPCFSHFSCWFTECDEVESDLEPSDTAHQEQGSTSPEHGPWSVQSSTPLVSAPMPPAGEAVAG